jgi:hypothetical protein
MKMECNIDKRGRVARIVVGSLFDLVGTGLVVWGFLQGRLAMIIGGAAMAAAGVFMIFEGVKGWCAARAMGIKTPM